MRTVLILLGSEVRRFLHDKTALSLTFLVPAVLIYIFGHVFGVTGDSGSKGIPIAVVSESDAPVVGQITAALKKEKAFKVLTTEKRGDQEVPLTEARVREQMHTGAVRFALVFPPDTQSDESFGLKLKFLNNPRNEIETQTVNGLVQKTIYTSAPQALVASLQKKGAQVIGQENFDQFNHAIANSVAQAFGGDASEIYESLSKGQIDFGGSANATDGGSSLFDSLIKIESDQIGGTQQKKSSMATRSVGGWAIMFLLFSLSGSHILWSKYLFGMLVGLVQLCTLFLTGRLLFGIDIASNFGNLLLICLAASMACVSFGMLLAAVSPTSAAASGLGTFLILTMSAIGGAWFPTSFMPEFIQKLSRLTIVYWSLDGFIKVLWANCTTLELLPTLGVLLGIAFLVNIVSIWRFQHGQIFE